MMAETTLPSPSTSTAWPPPRLRKCGTGAGVCWTDLPFACRSILDAREGVVAGESEVVGGGASACSCCAWNAALRAARSAARRAAGSSDEDILPLRTNERLGDVRAVGSF